MVPLVNQQEENMLKVSGLLLVLCSSAMAQTSGCGTLCPTVSPEVARWQYQNDPERKREQQVKRIRVFICQEQGQGFICLEK